VVVGCVAAGALRPLPCPAVIEPSDALRALARQLRDEDTVISPHVVEPSVAPGLGELVASGPGAVGDPGAYALVVECVREGYLLHFGEPRVVVTDDADLRLLAGDYLYARGIERLGTLGDLGAIRELSELISLAAQLHAADRARGDIDALWIASTVAIAVGIAGRSPDDIDEDPSAQEAAAELKSARRDVRQGEVDAAARLTEVAHDLAARVGLAERLRLAVEAIDLRAV